MPICSQNPKAKEGLDSSVTDSPPGEPDVMEKVIAVLFLVVVLASGIGCQVMRYRECRSHGFSVYYCIPR